MCFDLESLCIWIVVIVGVVAIFQAVLPWLMSIVSLPAIVVTIIKIAIWMILAIAVIKIIFNLLSCLGFGFGHSRF